MMNKLQFLKILEDSLTALPKDERDSAVKYYEEFFDEADSDEKAIDNLGDPRKIAEQILVENGINPVTANENSFKNIEPVKPVAQSATSNTARTSNSTNLILAIIVVALTFPFWVTILAVAFSIFVAILAVAFTLVVTMGAVAVCGILAGIVTLFTFPPIGLISLGTGLVAAGMLTLFCVPLIKTCWKFTVWTVNTTVNFVKRLFFKQEVSV
ncbi:MAG: DUF1700 domain-containing protein [Clostridiales bacterium]|nr:DUF1700 domain-containing protein [Clostridiales bacterium]